MDDWTIRPARAQDAEALAACIRTAYAAHRERIADLPPVETGISDDIRDNLVWVAVWRGAIVGGLVLIPRGDHMVLANIAVAPKASGAGIGGALIRLAEEQAMRHGLTELRLSTHADLPENVALYRHLGWVVTGRPGRKVTMAKTLSQP